jgi:TetR/AcrR family transcriptional regulator, repressor for uid operon
VSCSRPPDFPAVGLKPKSIPMPKLKPATQAARRDHILDAAEHCFARAGFHRTTMQDICKAASVSPGALYVYFDSKEALIAGLCERDRAEFAERFAELAKAPDFLTALNKLAEHYFAEEPPHKRLMCVEMGVEATRNPRIAGIVRNVDEFVLSSFEALFHRLKAEGRIAPALDIPTVARTFMILGDGLFWRRATDPNFDAKAVLPVITGLLGSILNPVTPSGPYPNKTKNQKRIEIAS